jgi:hypothetical protein
MCKALIAWQWQTFINNQRMQKKNIPFAIKKIADI